MASSERAAVEIRQIGPDRLDLFARLMTVFGEVFDEPDTYGGRPPRPAYLRSLLGGDAFIALAATRGDIVLGGLAAYVLQKFERQRAEVHIYDLAVAAAFRRQGIATALIEALIDIARARGAWLVFVQANTETEDQPAIALYSKFGRREDILHFEIELDPPSLADPP